MNYDYLEGVCLTAEAHRLELAKQLKYNLANLTPEEIANQDYIIEEYGRIMQKLADEYEGGELLTINYFEGMNAFMIEEGE